MTEGRFFWIDSPQSHQGGGCAWRLRGKSDAGILNATAAPRYCYHRGLVDPGPLELALALAVRATALDAASKAAHTAHKARDCRIAKRLTAIDAQQVRATMRTELCFAPCVRFP